MILMVFDTEEEANKFMRLYEKYRKIVYYTVKRFIDNEADIEDFLQDIYILVGKNLEKIDEKNEKKTQNYLITITRNYCISHWRKEKTIQEDEYCDSIDYADEKYNPVNILINKEAYAAVKKALNKLDVKYRSALELKYFNDLDDASIAKILNIEKKNVQMRIYRAKRLMRSYMEEMENE